MARKEWTPEERQFVKEHAHKKSPWIAARLGRTASQVRMMKKRLRVTTSKPELARNEAELRRHHAEGVSDAVIADRLGVNKETVRRWRIKLGLGENGWSEVTRAVQARVAATTCRRRRKDERIGPEGLPAHSIEATYSDEQAAWLAAVGRLRSKLGRVPTLQEAFRLAIEMGYAKTAERGTRPALRRGILKKSGRRHVRPTAAEGGAR